MHNQKKNNNQFKNNKQPEVPENQTACNSDNQGVKETFTQTGRRGRDRRRAAKWRGHLARQWTMLKRQGWLNGKLRLKASCKLWQGLPWQEKFPVSHESSLESGARAEQESGIVPSLTPPPQIAP